MWNSLTRFGKSSSVELDLSFFGSRSHFKFIDLEVWGSLDGGYQYGCIFGLFGWTAQMHVSLFMKPPTKD